MSNVTWTPLSRSKCQLAGGRAYCGGLPHSLLTWLKDRCLSLINNICCSYSDVISTRYQLTQVVIETGYYNEHHFNWDTVYTNSFLICNCNCSYLQHT